MIVFLGRVIRNLVVGRGVSRVFGGKDEGGLVIVFRRVFLEMEEEV